MTFPSQQSGLSRRTFLTRGAMAAASTSLFWTPAARAEMPMPKATGALDDKLDAYIAAYMPAMNAPGLTLGLTDTGHTLRTAGYGYANVDLRLPVSQDHLFQIGSITKSFVALVLLQLHDEGQLDLQKPILDYLPWLPITEPFGPITVHHLLTHTSGLPDNQGVFSTDPNARLAQGFKPGDHFHYCNAGFDILGELAARLDGRTWHQCVQARILTPLAMTQTSGVIATASRDRSAIGYEPYWDDQAYLRQGKLAPASNMVMDDTAGCIASTPGDMATYLRMLLNRGQGPKGQIVSKESFELFSTPYIKADDFSPTASYGYGIAVDTLEGHKILRHTGGMVSFASSIHVDLDGAVAAFASINAMQGYRPTAVTEYAVRLLRTQHESTPLPEPPLVADALEVENASDYAGTFTLASTSKNGHTLIFKAQGKQLLLTVPGAPAPYAMQHAGGDAFLVNDEALRLTFPFVFARKDSPKESAAAENEPNADKPKPPVVEVSYGQDWYTGEAYDGPKTFDAAKELAAYAGHYRSDSPWGGDARVYVLKDQLMLSGLPLTPIGNGIFRAGDEPWTPDTAEFHHIVDGKPRLMKSSGIDFWRLEVE
jgi:CubicO group peptidase (beta-lactamase class C family)